MPTHPTGDAPTATLGAGEQLKLLENIIQKLLFRDVVAQPQQCSGPTEVKVHLERLQQYFNLAKINSNEQKIAILLNSITEDMRMELCCQLDYTAHEDDFDWIEQKLLSLFHPKESEITPMIKLYSIRQKPQQTLREFLSEIRIEGYKLLKSLNPEEREKHLVDAYKKGLRSKELKTALHSREIDTLEEVFQLIKKEKCPKDDVYHTRQMNINEDVNIYNEVRDLKKDVKSIQTQLESIATILRGLKALQPSYADAARKAGGYQRQGPSERRNYGTERPALAIPQYGARRQGVTQERQFSQRFQGRRQMPTFSDNQRNIPQCWTCGENGHIARFCRQITCYKCGKTGHVATDCLRYRQTRQIRCLENVENPWTSESDSSTAELDSESASQVEMNRQEVEAQIHILDMDNEPESHLHALTIHPNSLEDSHHKMPRKLDSCKMNSRHKKRYSKEINELADYIEGRAKKPRSSASTLISDTHSERAQNKPVVKGWCGNTKTKLFCDSGAEVNVIDNNLFAKLTMNGKNIKIHPARKVIRCANNSKISVLGWARLSISVAGFRKTCKFWVVPQIFPRIILGIRAMKDLEMVIDPARDCVWVKGVREPFLSKIHSQTLVSKCPGKGRLPGLRVEGRQV